ncbi:MAG: hypothetical protein KHW62_00340 [Clostridiales bacterium]|nr:hypothetical protein [Clostridiales bacterium]
MLSEKIIKKLAKVVEGPEGNAKISEETKIFNLNAYTKAKSKAKTTEDFVKQKQKNIILTVSRTIIFSVFSSTKIV